MNRSRLTIEAGKAEQHYRANLGQYLKLFDFLSWRPLLVRYKQTVTGVLRAVMHPVPTNAVIIFCRKLPSGGVPSYFRKPERAFAAVV
jgi:lipopolysaccharide transport system permease protein